MPEAGYCADVSTGNEAKLRGDRQKVAAEVTLKMTAKMTEKVTLKVTER